MKTIKSHTAHGNQFFYVETNHGFMCSFSRSFNDVWFCDDLDTDTPTDSPDHETVEALITEVTESMNCIISNPSNPPLPLRPTLIII